VKRPVLEDRLGDRYILFGEWVYARHSVNYRQLPHYFFESDTYDKQGEEFLSLERRHALLDSTGIHTVPALHVGALDREKLVALIGQSRFDSEFENPFTNRINHLMEGLYLRIEHDGIVFGAGTVCTARVCREGQAESPLAVPNNDRESIERRGGHVVMTWNELCTSSHDDILGCAEDQPWCGAMAECEQDEG
jgi:hypothetical protein